MQQTETTVFGSTMKNVRVELIVLFLVAASTPLATSFAQTWAYSYVDYPTYWYGISFSDSLTGTIVGNGGKIYRTTSGGASWTAQSSGTTKDLYGVSFVNANVGTAVGNDYTSRIILRTTDGGSTWSEQTSAATAYDALSGVSFADSSHGIAVGRNYGQYAQDYHYVILRTTDGGTNWTRTVTGGPQLISVSFPDTNHAIAVGDSGRIYRTTNGGATWTQQTSGTNNTLYSVSLTDSSHGTAVGASGTILRTTDGGATWTAQISGTTSTLLGVSFFDTNNGMAVGVIVNLRTNDGGTNWVQQPNLSVQMYKPFLRTVNKATVAAYQGLVLSTSNGATVTPATATTGAASSVDIASATLSGSVDAKGAITTVRFLRGTTSGTYTDSIVASQSPLSGSTTLTSTGVSVPLSGLNPNTTYYVRVAAQNFLSYVRGSEISFTTFASLPPTLSTGSPSNVTFNSATLAGSIQTHGPGTTVRFVFGKTSGLYTDSIATAQSPITDSTVTSVSASVAGLDTGTTYYVRIAASNSLFYVRGAEASFSTTPILAPTVAATLPTNVGANIATFNGTLNTHGLPTSVRFLRGTVSGTYTDSVDAAQSPVTDSTTNTLSAFVTGLNPGTTYFVRIAANNGYYYVRSGETSLTTTTLSAPTVATSAASGVGNTSATLNGSVNSYGTSTTVRFLRGTVSGIYTDSVLASQSPVLSASSSTVSAALTGLSPNSTYYIRVVANSGTYYVRGNEVSFTTYAGQASGSALSIAPSGNYVEVPYASGLNPATNFTVEFWARPEGGDGGYRCPLGTENGVSSGYYFYDSPSNAWQCWMGDGSTWQIITGPTATIGSWDHVAMTYSTDTVKFYVNGVLYGAIPATYSVNTNMPLRIGALAESGSIYTWNGEVDEVRLWSVVRTQKQIRENMHRNLSDSTTNMIAYFPLNEGTGTTTSSLVGGYAGTLTGSPTWVTSSIPLGVGTSASVCAFTTGTATLGLLSLTMTDDFDNAVDLTATTIAASPNTLPSGYSSLVGKEYFILHAYGSPGTFSTKLSVNYGGGVLPSEVDSYPGGLRLYTRSSNSAGSWTLVGGADSAKASNGFARWSAITSFSQFAVVIEPTGLGPVPAPTTSAATFVQAQTARLNGSVNANGLAASVRFVLGTASNTYSDSITVLQSPVSGSSNTSVDCDVSNLAANTTYYARLAASNAYNYVRGNEVSFTTAPPESAGFALTFNGVDDRIVVPDDSALDLTTTVTVEAWVKLTASGNHWIVGKEPVNTAYELYIDTYNSNQFVFQVNGDGMIVGGTPTFGTWTHVAGTYDGSTLRLYMNGVLVASGPYSSPITATAGPLSVGAFDYGYNAYPLNGTVDEVRVWSVARTQTQIREGMHTVLPSTSGLVAYFKFNEGTGSTVTSIVGDHVGTFSNAPAWSASTAPLGTGTSASTSSIVSGSASMGSVRVTTTEDFDNAIDLTATAVLANPNVFPAGYDSVIGNRYFIVNAFGTPGTFSARLSLNFGTALDSRVTGFPAGAKLYRRNSASDGAWTPVGGADSANADSGYVRWSGITSFSQFAAVYDETALPVEAAELTAVADPGSVTLSWKTHSEVDNDGFNILRKDTSATSFTRVSGFADNDALKGLGTSGIGHAYRFTDTHVIPGTRYQYRIQTQSRSGKTEDIGTLSVTVGVAKVYALYQNYPNPFNPTTKIGFTLEHDGRASLKIYDILGREVESLVDENRKAGVYHQVVFDASRFASGVYFAVLQAGGKHFLKKMLLLK